MLLRRYISLMHFNNATSGNFDTDFILGNFSFFYHPSYVQVTGSFPIELVKEVCNTKFFHKSLFLSVDEKDLNLDDCVTSPTLRIGLSQYVLDAGVLNFDYNKYCSDYDQYRKELIDISKEKGEELFIENLYFTSLSTLESVLEILKNCDLLPKGISN